MNEKTAHSFLPKMRRLEPFKNNVAAMFVHRAWVMGINMSQIQKLSITPSAMKLNH